MYGLSIICLICYALSIYLVLINPGENNEYKTFGNYLFLIAIILSVVVGIMANE